MIPGITKFPQAPIASLPAGLRASTPNQFAALLTNPDAELVILLIASPFSSSVTRKISALPAMVAALPIASGKCISIVGGEDDLYLSDKGYTTDASDSIPHMNFPGRLSPALSRTISLFDSSEPTGAGVTSIGDVVIQNNDGEMDALLEKAWDGRDLKLIAGQEGIPLNAFGTVLKGTALSINANNKRISLRINDPAAFFQLPLERNKFAGTGGAEGDSDLKDQSRPYVAGRVRNITPYLVSSSDLLYQVHDGEVSAIDGVRDKGVALTSAGDWSTVTALLAATTGIGGSGADIEAGEYGTCLAEGYFRLGGQPVGLTTADVKGDADPDYVETTGAIVKRIVSSRLGAFNLQNDRLELSSFSRLDTAQPATVGVYVDQDSTVANVITSLMNGVGGYWYFNRAGKLVVDRLESPSAPVVEIDDEDIDSIFRLDLPVPVWRRSVTWFKSWTKQGPDELAGSVVDADRQLYGNDFRYAVNEDSAIKNKHRFARKVITPGLFDIEADAIAESERLALLHGVDRSRYRIKIKRALFRISPNNHIKITYPRYNLTAGRDFVVAALQEESKTGTTTLEVWG
tara:strand:- start:4823 stop:6544 length:1722 start_codon:yes stop_codon:yes gene_type:complete